MKKRTLLTSRQVEILRLRKGGLTQDQVAKLLGTTRENVSIVERNAFQVLRAAKSTIEAFESLDASTVITIPERTPIFDIPRIILVRGDVLGIKMRTHEDDILAIVKSKGKIRGHHLTSPITVQIMPDGTLSGGGRGSLAASGQGYSLTQDSANVFGTLQQPPPRPSRIVKRPPRVEKARRT